MTIVLTENMKKALKSISRGLKGWDTTFPRQNDLNKRDSGINYGRPHEIMKNVGNSETSFLRSTANRKDVTKGSPADLQSRLAARELRRRGAK